MKFRKTWKIKRVIDFDKIDKQREKYPDIVEKIIEISDVILEVLDSRFIEETRNKEIEEKIRKKGKKIIFVLNKCDLVDTKNIPIPPDVRPYVFVSTKKRIGSRILRRLIKKESSYRDKRFKRAQVGVIGYPNTGKSSLINFLTGKNSAKTAKEAGFTKGMQKIRLSSDILLIDTPGVIPNEYYSNEDIAKIAFHAKVGARNYYKVKDPDFIVQDLLKVYSKELCEFYQIPEVQNADEFLEILGKKKNFLVKGGEVDIDRTSRLVLKDWQEGKFFLFKKERVKESEEAH
ncbi:MAG: GTPase, partial [Candidatus Pacearchaeota archaeon]